MATKPKIIVLDDDPTGSQTVHSCLLLMRWDVDTLIMGLRDESPIFFILTNTRAMTPQRATETTREVCRNLKTAIAQENISDFLIVSRSDSTLRGHYPIETDAIAEELGGFDGHFLTPAFFEGGRFTRDSVHYLLVNGVETPVHKTEFAQDSVFGYSHSYLPDYVEEKTQGSIRAGDVLRFTRSDIHNGCLETLLQMHDNQCGVVDGETQADLDKFAEDVLEAAKQGKRFLFRSAASLLTSLAQPGQQPVAAENMSRYVRSDRPGAVLVGSHVRKTTTQLENLLPEPDVEGVEVDVSHLLEDTQQQRDDLLKQTLDRVREIYERNQTPVIYTSRQEIQFSDSSTRLAFGEKVSHLLMDIVRGLPSELGFLISKGGITSNDVLSKGLNLTSARLLGQILAGCSVVRTPADHPQFSNLPVVLFPGNVGDERALATVHRRFRP